MLCAQYLVLCGVGSGKTRSPVGLQLVASMGWPSEGSRLRKLRIVDFMPLKSKMRRLLSLLPDSSREPV